MPNHRKPAGTALTKTIQAYQFFQLYLLPCRSRDVSLDNTFKNYIIYAGFVELKRLCTQLWWFLVKGKGGALIRDVFSLAALRTMVAKFFNNV
jgi:hypothetical protein